MCFKRWIKPGKSVSEGGLILFFCLFFSPAFAVNPASNPPFAGVVTPVNNSSVVDTAAAFTATYADPEGAKDLSDVYLMIDTKLAGDHAFFGRYNLKENKLYLRNDSGSDWMSTNFAPGTAARIENSYAALDCAKTTVSTSGTVLTVTWEIIFKPAFAGTQPKNIYIFAADTKNVNSGWQTKGTWEVKAGTVPTASYITPVNSSSVADTAISFTATYADPEGAKDLSDVYLMIDTKLAGDHAFFGRYNLTENKLYLRNDSGSDWMPTNFAPGTAARIENSYAVLDCAKTSVVMSGTVLTVTWGVTFKLAFAGTQPKNIYIFAADTKNVNSGWQTKGTWEVKVKTDTAPPTGSIKINNGASSTDSVSVTLTLSAVDTGSGVAQMKFSNDNLTWSTPESYATTRVWTLIPGNGTKTVYVKYKDTTGNWSASVPATIVLNVIEVQLINGKAISGSIVVPGEHDIFTFNANAGDTITIRPTPTQGFMLFYLELYAPGGSEIAEDFAIFEGFNTTLSVTGKYTLTLRTYFRNETGPYSIVYATVSNNNWAPAISYGQTVTGTITYTDRIMFYQFSGKAGEVLSLSANRISGSLDPKIELYGPSGAFMGEGSEQINKYLPVTGKYTILVHDEFDLFFGGSYKLTCVRKTDAVPAVVAISPVSGFSKANEQVIFIATYSDADGPLDIQGAYLLVNLSAANAANGLYAYYDSASDKLYLRDDKNEDWLGGYAPGVPLVVENSYAKLNCRDTKISISGNTMTVNWAVSFKPLFGGRSYNSYLAVTDSYDASSGLLQKGTWRIDQQDSAIEIISFLPAEKSGFLEGDAIPCSAQASPAERVYLYQFVVDDQVKRDFSAQNSWDWLTTAQDRGARTLTVKAKNEYGVIKEKSRRLIIYRRPIEPQ